MQIPYPTETDMEVSFPEPYAWNSPVAPSGKIHKLVQTDPTYSWAERKNLLNMPVEMTG